MAVDFFYPAYEVVRNQDRCITCRVCGTKMVAKVAKDDTLRYFAVFEDAAQSTASAACRSARPAR